MSAEAKEKVDEWMNASVRNDLRRMLQWIRDRKRKLSIVSAWGVVFALITFKSYSLIYLQNPFLRQAPVIYTTNLQQFIPRLGSLDYILMIVVSIFVGALLSDVGDVLYGWLASTSISFVLSTLLAFLFMWYFIGLGSHFAELNVSDIMMPWVGQFVMLNVFRMWFPIVPIMSLIAVFAGSFARTLL